MENKCDYCEEEFFGNGIVITSFPRASLDLTGLFCSEECRKKQQELNEEICSLFA